MRFWLSRVGTSSQIMAVDNASVSGMDYTALAANIRLVEWRSSGEGEIEYNDRPPLREKTVDVLPFCPFFNQFLTKLTGITLAQAKRVKIELVGEVYDSKRQAPYHYVVAAGDYNWDATDDALVSSTIPAIQNATAKINTIVTQLNAAITYLNNTVIVTYNNDMIVGNNLTAQVNSTVAGGVNTLVTEINASIVYNGNLAFYDINNSTGALVIYMNGTLLGGVNAGLVQGGVPPAPGLTDAIVTVSWSANPYTLANVNYIGTVAPGTFAAASAIPWTTLTPVSVSNVQWIPVGGTTPVTVTPTEAAAIMSGIAVRSNDLAVKKNTKIGQINALSTVAAVIAYDVTTGW